MAMIRLARLVVAFAMVLVTAAPALAQLPDAPSLFQVPAAGGARAIPSNVSVGVVSFRAVAEKSQLGKAAILTLQAMQDRKAGELKVFETRLQGLRTQRQSQATVAAEAALAALDRDIDRVTRDLQHAQQEADLEMQDLRTQLMSDLQKKVVQAVALVAKDKGVALVFDADAMVYVDSGLDLSDEVVKRLDTLPKG